MARNKKSLHGDIDVICISAFGKLAEENLLTPEYLAVQSSKKLNITKCHSSTDFVTIRFSE